MSSTIKLPSGKLIDLSRFVAMLPAENKYQLSLDGANTTIELDTEDAEYIHQQLQLVSNRNNKQVKEQWDKTAQLRKNQPLMQLIESFKKTMDAHRPVGRKLYEQ